MNYLLNDNITCDQKCDQLWDDYANNKITASHLLKKCGNLYTPGV
jgi:hypothetical protein